MKLQVFSVLCTVLAMSAAAQTLHFHGTVGQRSATLVVDVDDDSVTHAHYRYDRESTDVPFAEERFFGTTLILADEDGNVFHLHLQDASGNGVKDFAHAEKLQGTMSRDELDLPVLLERVSLPSVRTLPAPR